MVMPLLSPAAGNLLFQLPEGSILNSNDLIARLELDSPDAVVAAEQFRGTFPELGPPQVSSHGVDHRFQQARTAAQMTLAGGWQCLRTLGLTKLPFAQVATPVQDSSRPLLAAGTHCRPEDADALQGLMSFAALTGCARPCKLQHGHAWQTCLRFHQIF